jgi:hypothetical protein
MGRHDDIGTPLVTNPNARVDLCAEIDRDARNEAVEELYEQAAEIYYQASESTVCCNVDEAGLKAALRLAWEAWGCGER